MKEYYKNRAQAYDRVYTYPERQQDLRFLEGYIPAQLSGLDVLEVAAGTGYWSQFIVETANSLLATDINQETLNLINQRRLKSAIDTLVIDAFDLADVPGKFNGLFSGLWLSHIPKQRLGSFLSLVHQRLKEGATVVFIDNTPAQQVRIPIIDEDDFGNTFQNRILDDGSSHRVLKNFPTEKELLVMTAPVAAEQEYISLDHFWAFRYTLNRCRDDS